MRKTTQLCICVLFAGILADATAAKVEFNYQGQVSVQDVPFTGTGQFKLAIVNTAGAVSLWSNDKTSVNGGEPTTHITAPVVDGIFNIVVGETPTMSPLPAHIFNSGEDIFLRVWFSDGTHGFQMLQPDRRITNVELLGQTSGDEDTTVYVNGATGNDRYAGLDPAHPKKTIQAAVTVVPRLLRSNTVIQVAPGVYREQVSIFGITVAPGKSLRLIGDPTWNTTSTLPPTVRITGADDDLSSGVRNSGVIVQQSANVGVEGFQVDKTLGTGIYVLGSSGVLVYRCKMRECSQGLVEYRGGIPTPGSTINASGAGVGIDHSVAKVFDCVLEYCFGGIGWDSSRGEEMNIIATHNTSSGTMVVNASTVWFYGSYLADRNGGDGIGVMSFSSACFIQSYPPAYHGTYTNNSAHGISVAYIGLLTGMGSGHTYSNNAMGNLNVNSDSRSY